MDENTTSKGNGLKDRAFHERHKLVTWLDNFKRKRKYKGQKSDNKRLEV